MRIHQVCNSVLQLDPTRTITLRKQFMADMTRRFKVIRREIVRAVGELDVFGLAPRNTSQTLQVLAGGLTPRQFEFRRTDRKIDAFMAWLEELQNQNILEISTRVGTHIGSQPWTNKYIYTAYQKGIYRARRELRNRGYNVPTATGLTPRGMGAIAVAMNRPIHAERVAMMYLRTFNELKGVTDAMDQQISRTLSLGLAEGRNPMDLARTLADRVDKIGITRARTIARTEIIAAHHKATIGEYREWGADQVKVRAEWATAGGGVCEICAGLEGRTFTLDEIENMIPVHPNCRCCALPVDVTEVEKPKPKPKKKTVKKKTTTPVPKKKTVKKTVPKPTPKPKKKTVKKKTDWSSPEAYLDLGKKRMEELIGKASADRLNHLIDVRKSFREIALKLDTVEAEARISKMKFKMRLKGKSLSAAERKRIEERIEFIRSQTMTAKEMKDYQKYYTEWKKHQAEFNSLVSDLHSKMHRKPVWQMDPSEIQEMEKRIRKHIKIKVPARYEGQVMDSLYGIDSMIGIEKLPKGLKIILDEPRGYADRRNVVINIGKHGHTDLTLFHECGHFMEYRSDEYLSAVVKWRNARATAWARSQGKTAAELAPLGGGYGASEYAYRDTFLHEYIGKVYQNFLGEDNSTEVVSMALERMAYSNNMAELIEKDPDHFFLVLGILSRL